jgi:glycerophosphoryl diester phosphodiesterase
MVLEKRNISATLVNQTKTVAVIWLFMILVHPQNMIAQEKNKTYRPLVIAHRGASAIAPENTLSAIKKAIEMGVDMIELDVQLTKDKQIVLMHDLTVDRTTNGKGRVRDLTFEEIRKLDAGLWFSKNYEGEKIPTLEEVMQAARGKCKLLIEVKRVKTNKPEIEAKIIQLIDKYDARSWCIVQSFETEVVKNIQSIDSSIECHKLVTMNLPVIPMHLDSRIKTGTIYKYKTVQSINPYFKMLNKRKVDKIHARGQKIITWTVNEKDDMKRMISYGVDGIITNYPDRLLELLK